MQQILVILGFSLIYFLPHSTQTDPLSGRWFSEEMDRSVIELSSKNAQFEAKIVQSDNAKFVGKVILKQCAFNEEKKKWMGVMVHPGNGMEINAELIRLNEQQLKVVGSKLFMTKTFIWEKK